MEESALRPALAGRRGLMKQARCVAGKIKHHNCRLIFEMTRFGPILLERQSVEAQIVLQVTESRVLFVLNELRHRISNKPLMLDRFLSGTFGTKVTTRPLSARPHHWCAAPLTSAVHRKRASVEAPGTRFEAPSLPTRYPPATLSERESKSPTIAPAIGCPVNGSPYA
jgi:hypothetical protein